MPWLAPKLGTHHSSHVLPSSSIPFLFLPPLPAALICAFSWSISQYLAGGTITVFFLSPFFFKSCYLSIAEMFCNDDMRDIDLGETNRWNRLVFMICYGFLGGL